MLVAYEQNITLCISKYQVYYRHASSAKENWIQANPVLRAVLHSNVLQTQCTFHYMKTWPHPANKSREEDVHLRFLFQATVLLLHDVCNVQGRLDGTTLATGVVI